MAWIYLAESADSLKPYKGTSDLSPTVKTTDTLKAYCSLEWLGVPCLSHLYGIVPQW